MEINLQHEDLLIKLRAKLNDEKVKLWESPYISDNGVSQNMQDLAMKYALELSMDQEIILAALSELQLHSVDRSKANAEFKETGCATFRLKAMVPGEKPKVMKIQKKLDVMGSELIDVVAEEVKVVATRVKLIFNGKVIKPTSSLEEQGVKNSAQIMALIMAETPEEVKKEDTMYMEMKTTRDDATLLSESVEDLAGDEEYMKLEDQSGKAVVLPAVEKRALLVGLALHERGRGAAQQRDYPLALVLLLEADRQLSECSSSILKSVDNWAVLQLDISWCYLCLQSLPAATDAAQRLAKAEAAFRDTYGENHQRLIALKGSAANERVLLMRMYLLQGIVAYHQNKREDARKLLEKAENELNCLRVDPGAVAALVELGWSAGAARRGLRAAAGDVDAAHHYLADCRLQRHAARGTHRRDRQQRLAGACADGSAVSQQLVDALVGMGYTRVLATLALRHSNNHVADAVRLIQDQPELLVDSDLASDGLDTPDSDDSTNEPDNRLIAELEAMGYNGKAARAALRHARNDPAAALDILLASLGHTNPDDPANPSTSACAEVMKTINLRRKAREEALERLTRAIKTEDDDYLDTSLVEEEEYLVQYKSLL